MKKFFNNDNIYNDAIDTLKLSKLRENNQQLSDVKKGKYGFGLNESVIDIEQNGYGISYSNDILYTYGIEPCCGLIFCNDKARMLFHLDGTITTEDVMDITKKIGLSQDTIVMVVPGVSCGINGSFNYRKIEEEYKKMGYKVIEQRIPAGYGFIKLELDKVTIGTTINRSKDIVLPIFSKTVQDSSYESNYDGIKELTDLKDMNYNILK